MKVNLFVPCFIDQMHPTTAWSTVALLEKSGCEVNYNPEQTCCGQPLFNGGDVKRAKKIAAKFISDFADDIPIVTPSASCAGYIRNYYTSLFKDDEMMLPQALQMKRNVVELCDFLVNTRTMVDFSSRFKHKVTYHDACSALREYGLKDEPRQLLSRVEGLELVEMPKRDECCGFGGTFMIKYAPVSTAMVEQKVENALSTGAQYIVSTEASCLINIQSYINKQKLAIKTIHMADLLMGKE